MKSESEKGIKRVKSSAVLLLGVTVCGALLGFGATEPDASGIVEEMEFELEVGYASRYMSEGRDELNGDGLGITMLTATLHNNFVGFWYATSPDEDYREYELFIGRTFEWREFELSLWYTHLRLPSEKEHDNEVALELIVAPLPWGLNCGLEAMWSFDAKGAFLEASVERETELCRWLTLIPSLSLGWNEGFVEDGHDGVNHVAAALEALLPLKDNTDLSLQGCYSRALRSNAERYPGDELLKNRLTFGVMLKSTF